MPYNRPGIGMNAITRLRGCRDIRLLELTFADLSVKSIHTIERQFPRLTKLDLALRVTTQISIQSIVSVIDIAIQRPHQLIHCLFSDSLRESFNALNRQKPHNLEIKFLWCPLM